MSNLVKLRSVCATLPSPSREPPLGGIPLNMKNYDDLYTSVVYLHQDFTRLGGWSSFEDVGEDNTAIIFETEKARFILKRYIQPKRSLKTVLDVVRYNHPIKWHVFFASQMHFFLSQRPIYAEGVSVVPSIDNIFRAERLTSPDNIRAVIVGQDPYPQAGVATGLAFDSHINNRKIPYANLRIQEEIAREYPRENPPVFTTKNKKEIVGVPFEKKPHGDLSRWAIEEGVLLINISETTLLENPNAHKNYWIGFVDSLIRFVCKKNKNIVFFLWGREAQTIEKSIIGSHLVLKTSHPSYTYHNGKSGDSFAGSNHFIEANKFFASKNLPLINWNITK